MPSFIVEDFNEDARQYRININTEPLCKITQGVIPGPWHLEFSCQDDDSSGTGTVKSFEENLLFTLEIEKAEGQDDCIPEASESEKEAEK